MTCDLALVQIIASGKTQGLGYSVGLHDILHKPVGSLTFNFTNFMT